MARGSGVTLVTFVILGTVTLGGCPDAKLRGAQPVADSSGKIHVPEDYLRTYQYVGTWAVSTDESPGANELHVVYASPGAVADYQKTGQFPDDAVLVKEVILAATEQMVTGIVSYPGTLKGWFVMVKDSKNRYPGNKLWGDGWGWAWFDVGDPSNTTSTDYKIDCLQCHIPARATDWVYVQGYPLLKQ
jgi:hypothetical protein